MTSLYVELNDDERLSFTSDPAASGFRSHPLHARSASSEDFAKGGGSFMEMREPVLRRQLRQAEGIRPRCPRGVVAGPQLLSATPKA
jgi:hypothetical protein